MVLGKSGAGKSTSLRNFEPDEVGVFNVTWKPLPFRKKLKVANNATYEDIEKGLTGGKLKKYVIDDSQYLLSLEYFEKAKVTGYEKFTDLALHFERLIEVAAKKTPDDCIVYFLHHTEPDGDGGVKVKTIGKMLDDKLVVEGLFSIVLLCQTVGTEHQFLTTSDGTNPAKSPLEMFEPVIPNDLKLVDMKIREYYGWSDGKAEAKDEKA